MKNKPLQTPTAKYPEYLLLHEVAEILRLKPQTIRKWLHKGTYPINFPLPAKLGNKNMWRRSDIVAFIDGEFLKLSE